MMNNFQLPPNAPVQVPNPYKERMEQKLRRITQLEQGATLHGIVNQELRKRLNFVAEQIVPVAEALQMQAQQIGGNLDNFGRQIEAIDPANELLQRVEEAKDALQKGSEGQAILFQAVQKSENKLAIELQQYQELARKLQDAERAYQRSSSQVPHEKAIMAAGSSLCHYIGTGKPSF